MSNIRPLLVCSLLLEYTLLVSGYPLHHAVQPQQLGQHARQKRNYQSNRDAGIGVGLAILLSMLLVAAFYLGRQRERAGGWHCWGARKNPYEHDSNTSEKSGHNGFGPEKLKGQISSPVPVSTSNLAELQTSHEGSETESQPDPSELPTQEVYEMGMPSPKYPTSPKRPSWVDRARRWTRHSGQLDLSDSGDIKSQPEVAEVARRPIQIPESVYMIPRRGGAEERARKSTASALMDWRGSGLEHVRTMYAQRKSGLPS